MRGHAKAFDTAKEKLGLTDSLYLGLRTVPVDSIVGSVNRWRDFDARFRIKNRHTMYRYQQIKRRWNGAVPCRRFLCIKFATSTM